MCSDAVGQNCSISVFPNLLALWLTSSSVMGHMKTLLGGRGMLSSGFIAFSWSCWACGLRLAHRNDQKSLMVQLEVVLLNWKSLSVASTSYSEGLKRPIKLVTSLP